MKKIFLFLIVFLVLYFCVFTGKRTITYYTNGKCTLTKVEYKDWLNFDSWFDLYYGKLSYSDIDESRCFIRCEVRGGVSNGMVEALIHFNGDSIFVVANEGGYYKYNCNLDKLFLKKDFYAPEYNDFHYDIEHCKNKVYLTDGFFDNDTLKVRTENGINIEIQPTRFTLKFFNTMNSSDACDYYDSSE